MEYEIVTTVSGIKVLVVKRYMNPEKKPEIKEEDFDVVFFDIPEFTYNAIRYMLAKFSMLMSRKVQLKPKFMTPINASNLGRLSAVIDGFMLSETDANLAVRTAQINTQIKSYGIQPMVGNIESERDFFIRLCQYCLSRGMHTFTSSSSAVFRKGLSAVYSACLDLHDTVGIPGFPSDNQLRKFIVWLEKEGYCEKIKFIERTHICPKCEDDRLIFAESCNYCDSSHLKDEDMLHHFRCAHIAPESEFVFDNELRCPKCKHFLRHIGIDYDRPAKVSLCLDCGATLLHPVMKVRCTLCDNVTTPRMLKPFDIWECSFTKTGKQFLNAYKI